MGQSLDTRPQSPPIILILLNNPMLISSWFGPEHAAAVYAAMRHFEQAGLPSATDAESQDAGW
jgi:hypothetical protein